MLRTFRVMAGTAIAFAISSAVWAQETRTYVDDLGRSVEIPLSPQRIVSLEDQNVTIPLIELGVIPVASHGRVSNAGEFYVRGAFLLTGIDYSNSPMVFVGEDPFDIEAIAATNPDLIIGWTGAPVEQLESIAPTIVFDLNVANPFEIYERLADITGTRDRLAVLEGRYQAQLAQLARLVDTHSIMVVTMAGDNGLLSVQHTFGSLGRVLRDAGFLFPDLVNQLDLTQTEDGDFKLNAEVLLELNADVVFDTYRNDRNETPATADERMRTVAENYCDFLFACQNGQYFRLPREEAKAISYQSLSLMTQTLIALLSAQAVVTQER